jgi:hypothetical protein
MRVVEVNCRFQSYSGTDQGEMLEERIRLLSDNYGLAGPKFIERCLLENRIESVVKAAEEFDRMVRRTSEERFWCYGLGVCLAAGREAVRQGFLDYDINELEMWVRDTLLHELRREIKEKPKQSLNLLSEFLYHHLDCLLVVVQSERAYDMFEPKSTNIGGFQEQDPFVVKRPQRELKILMELKEEMIYVDKKFLDEWGAKNRISIQSMLEGLADEGIYDKQGALRYKLGKCVSMYNFGFSNCYAFNGERLNLTKEIAKEVIERPKEDLFK